MNNKIKLNKYGESRLHVASKAGDLQKVKELIKEGEDVNSVDYANWSILNDAVMNQNFELIKCLIEAGANVNHLGGSSKNERTTPLHDSCLIGDPLIIKLFLDAKADLNLFNGESKLPIDCLNESLKNSMIDKETKNNLLIIKKEIESKMEVRRPLNECSSNKILNQSNKLSECSNSDSKQLQLQTKDSSKTIYNTDDKTIKNSKKRNIDGTIKFNTVNSKSIAEVGNKLLKEKSLNKNFVSENSISNDNFLCNLTLSNSTHASISLPLELISKLFFQNQIGNFKDQLLLQQIPTESIPSEQVNTIKKKSFKKNRNNDKSISDDCLMIKNLKWHRKAAGNLGSYSEYLFIIPKEINSDLKKIGQNLLISKNQCNIRIKTKIISNLSIITFNLDSKEVINHIKKQDDVDNIKFNTNGFEIQYETNKPIKLNYLNSQIINFAMHLTVKSGSKFIVSVNERIVNCSIDVFMHEIRDQNKFELENEANEKNKKGNTCEDKNIDESTEEESDYGSNDN